MNLRDLEEDEQKKEFYAYLNKMPIYIKALEIYDTCYVLTDSLYAKYRTEFFFQLFELDELGLKTKKILLLIELQEKTENVMMPYTNTVVSCLYEIRIIAEDMLTDLEFLISNIKEEGDELYILQLIKEINEFRYLFIEWIKTYRHHGAKLDMWGLTNPLKQITDFKQNEDDSELYYGSSLLK